MSAQAYSSWQSGWVLTCGDPDDTPTANPRVRRAPENQTFADGALPTLVDAARSGDVDAFNELVRRTYAGTYSLARRLVSDEDDARDVVQETYLRAFRSIRRFRADAQFTTWLYRITANCASTHLGRRRRLRHDELDEQLAVADPRPEHDPVTAAEGSALRIRVQAAIAELPPRLRAVVVLRDQYDLNHAEIATELGISESAAKVRLHRARRRLNARVFPRRADETPDSAADLPVTEPKGRSRVV